MDVRRFPTEPWSGESENPQKANCRFSSVGEEPFFGYFLWLCKESSSPKAKRFRFADKKAKHFDRFAAEFISLLAQRNEPKKCLPRQINQGI